MWHVLYKRLSYSSVILKLKIVFKHRLLGSCFIPEPEWYLANGEHVQLLSSCSSMYHKSMIVVSSSYYVVTVWSPYFCLTETSAGCTEWLV